MKPRDDLDVDLLRFTWSAHNLSYALVSSITSPAKESCMVCHQSMADHGQFRRQP
jgi:hypothetical protein